MPRKRELLDSDEDEGRGPGRGSDRVVFPEDTLPFACPFSVSPVAFTAAELTTPGIHKKKRFQIEDDDDDDDD